MSTINDSSPDHVIVELSPGWLDAT